MVAHTKTLSGAGKDKALRRIVDSVAELPADLAELTAARLIDTIGSVRIRTKAFDALQSPVPKAPATPAPSSGLRKQSEDVSVTTPAFDPFIFSAVAVLARKGVPGLAAELASISGTAELHALAAAQHLGVDPSLTDANILRAAIVAGAQRRLADRKAAAS